jgi:hypothetical protein
MWNITDLWTVILSIMALGFFVARIFEVEKVLDNIAITKGNG